MKEEVVGRKLGPKRRSSRGTPIIVNHESLDRLQRYHGKKVK